MDESKEQLDALKDIRNMMENSSRFISLSGFSGVIAGVIALIGAYAAYVRFGYYDFVTYYIDHAADANDRKDMIQFVILDGLCVLVLSVSFCFGLSARKAIKNDQTIWNKTARRMIINLFIPLISGGLFCLILFYHQYVAMIAPATLIFYGLALVNGSKYTLEDIRYLGYMEIGLGLLSAWFIGYGLLFWSIGFGLLHIIYGLVMWNRYDRKN